jgi:hypothetical protein
MNYRPRVKKSQMVFQCWKGLKNTEVPVGAVWIGELAACSFSAPASDEELLAREWEAGIEDRG